MPELHRKCHRVENIMVVLNIQGAFHSTKKFVTLETRANGTKFSMEVSENPQFDEFPKYEPSNPKFGTLRKETQMERKFSLRILKFSVYMARCFSFLETTENALPFVTENLRKLK